MYEQQAKYSVQASSLGPSSHIEGFRIRCKTIRVTVQKTKHNSCASFRDGVVRSLWHISAGAYMFDAAGRLWSPKSGDLSKRCFWSAGLRDTRVLGKVFG